MMRNLAVSRKQRLRALENEIRKGMEEFYYTGMRLKEIRDDELYKEDGFRTWEDYCRKRWELSVERVRQLMRASEYRAVLPNPNQGLDSWSEKSVRELTRIPDKRQAARVAAKVVKAVEKSQKTASKNPTVKPIKLTSMTVRKFVDEDLGVNRAEKAAQTRRDREQSKPHLRDYLRSKIGVIEAIRENLAEVPKDAWDFLDTSNPGLIQQMATACDGLSKLMRSFRAGKDV